MSGPLAGGPRTVEAPGVPAYEERALAPRRHEHCVCVFVLNEDGRLHAQLEAMWAACDGVADVVVADGGSDDGSTAPERLAALGVNTLLVKIGPGRLGAQMRMAFHWALARGYAGVVVIDGNGKDGVEAIPAFVAALRRGVDHAQGSRFIPGGVSENMPPSRWVGVRLLHAPLVSLAARRRYTDTTNGFRAYSARLLADPRVAVLRDVFGGYELHYYLAIRAARLGFSVAELPVARRYEPGKVVTKISPVRGNLRVLGCLARACAGWYDPRPAEVAGS